MRKLYYKIGILFLLGVFTTIVESCNKLFPFSFSNKNDVTNCSVRELATDGFKIDSIIVNAKVEDTVLGKYGIITLFVHQPSGANYWPLVLSLNVGISDKAKIHNWPNVSMLAFKTANDIVKFQISANNGEIKNWVIKVVDNTLPVPDPNKKNTTLFGYTFTAIKQGNITVDPADINIVGDSILMNYYVDNAATALTFPITITPIIKIPTGAFYGGARRYVPGSAVTFRNATDTAGNITIVSADSSTSHTYHAVFKRNIGNSTSGSSSADITNFVINSYTPASALVSSKVFIDSVNRIVYIPTFASLSGKSDDGTFDNVVRVIMDSIVISKGATISSSTTTGVFQFSNYNDIKTIQITSENGKVRTWKIQLLNSPQLSNSSFENWGTSNGYPIISGGTWANSNSAPNSMVSDVIMVTPSNDAFEGDRSAELITKYIYRSASGVSAITPVSGGVVFAGVFNFSASESAIRNPISTYSYGVPFTTAPTYMHIALKYAPATPLVNANLTGFSSIFGNAVPNFSPYVVQGSDACSIWVKLYNAAGNVIGSGEFTTNKTIKDWMEVYIPITYTSQVAPAKIAVTCSSSKDALKYIGASGWKSGSPGNDLNGSILKIDNIILIYPHDLKLPPMPK